MNRAKMHIGWALAVTILGQGAAAEEAVETLTVVQLPPATPDRVYLSDVALPHVGDGRLFIVDGSSFEYLGLVSTGLFGLAILSNDRSEIFVATTYFSKRNRGDRLDQLEIYDSTTLKLKQEIEIPPKHAQALHYRGTMRTSSDGRLVFIQNATPASSVTVVDVKAGKTLSDVPTPGCWIILPAQAVANRFSTLCGDGTVVTITLDDSGQPAQQQRSARLFDAEKDPLFVQAEAIGEQYYFVSFLGNVQILDLGGETAQAVASWPLVAAEDAAAGWRPGGYQVLALHAPTGRLYVTMHDQGSDGSHKNPAKEIWVFDIKTKQRLQRAPGSDAIAIALTRNEHPTLYAYDTMKLGLVRYTVEPELAVSGRMDGLGETPVLIEMH